MARRKYYRMTPARRAALRKAQLASARKRKRKERLQKVAVGVGGFAALAVTRHSIRYAGDFRNIGKDYRDFKNFAKSTNNKRKKVVNKVRAKKANIRLKRNAKKAQQLTLW